MWQEWPRVAPWAEIGEVSRRTPVGTSQEADGPYKKPRARVVVTAFSPGRTDFN